MEEARPHCVPRGLVLINPGNPTGLSSLFPFLTKRKRNEKFPSGSFETSDTKDSLNVVLRRGIKGSTFGLTGVYKVTDNNFGRKNSIWAMGAIVSVILSIVFFQVRF